MKAPPPPVAPKPSWPRQTQNSVPSTTIPVPSINSIQSVDKKQEISRPMNVTNDEQQLSQKINRSSSTTQISINVEQTIPIRTKSRSIGESRLFDLQINSINFILFSII